MDQKHQKMIIFFYVFSLVDQWALFTRCEPLLLSTRGGGIGTRDANPDLRACPPAVMESVAAEFKDKTPRRNQNNRLIHDSRYATGLRNG